MFNFISGRIIEIGTNKIIIENCGIGYDIYSTSETLAKCQGKQEVQLFTYLYVKEDGLSLFGFFDKSEKEMFLKLISVNGIGPKLALSVLSGISSQKIAIAVVTGDATLLNKIKGVGKKTAERIILELKGKITAEGTELTSYEDDINNLGGSVNDAVLALVSLGMSRSEAVIAVNKVSDKSGTAEQILTAALKGSK